MIHRGLFTVAVIAALCGRSDAQVADRKNPDDLCRNPAEAAERIGSQELQIVSISRHEGKDRDYLVTARLDGPLSRAYLCFHVEQQVPMVKTLRTDGKQFVIE